MRLALLAVVHLAVCTALPLTKEESTVPVKSVSINHNEDVPAAINFQSEAVVELQKLSLAGMCFIALTGP